jgi:hypothetical protein
MVLQLPLQSREPLVHPRGRPQRGQFGGAAFDSRGRLEGPGSRPSSAGRQWPPIPSQDDLRRDRLETVAERHLEDPGNFSLALYSSEQIELLAREVAANKPDAIVVFCTGGRRTTRCC